MENLIRQSNRLAELLGSIRADRLHVRRNEAAGASDSRRGWGCIARSSSPRPRAKPWPSMKINGVPCSAFYLGYGEWIFPGIEYFLSHGPVPGRECERFVKTPELAREYVASFKSARRREGAIVFKPVRAFTAGEEPVAVSLFADADRMSALVFLAHYAHPLSRDRIETGFASACMSLFTIPLRYADEGHFAPGSMLPKIQAAAKFVQSKPGRIAVVTSLECAQAGLRGERGTTIRS